MQKISNTKVISGLLLVACLVQACRTATVPSTATDKQLLCYVCDNCAKVTKDTPLEVCDAEFFEHDSTTPVTVTDAITSSSTTATETTTDSMTTELTTDSTTTTTIATATSTNAEIAAKTTTTEADNTSSSTTTGSTTEAIPSPPTVGPLPSTTPEPIPPTVGFTLSPLDIENKPVDASNATGADSNSTKSRGLPLAMPQVADDYTYHCYRVQKKINGTVSMDRGCTRVTTPQSVCGQLKELNAGIELSKCVPCTNSSCNGSSILSVSMATLLLTLIATLLSRQ